MKRLHLLLATLLAFLPGAADAATTDNQFGDNYVEWTAAATCAPAGLGCGFSSDGTPTDDYYIIGGKDGTRDQNFVVAGFDPAITSAGGISITNGGLLVQPGQTVTLGGNLSITGGYLHLQGAVVWEGRIDGIVRTDDDTVTYTLDSTPVNVDAAMYMVWLDDEPENWSGELAGEQQVGPGLPEPGKFRPAYNRLMWAPVETYTSGNTIAIDLGNQDETLGTNNPPYAGHRGQESTSAIVSSYDVLELRTVTAITTTASITSLTRGDFGSHYIEWDTGAGITDECEGKVAKVMTVHDGGVNDVVYVMGDVSHCGSAATFKLTKGDRVGDRVAIVDPAILDLNDTGTITWGGGKFLCEWCIVQRAGTLDTASNPDRWTGDSVGAFGGTDVACGGDTAMTVFPFSASVSPDAANSFIQNAWFRYWNEGATSTNGLTFCSRTSSAGTGSERFGSPLDLSGFTFNRVFLGDVVDDVRATFGVHMITVQGVRGLHLKSVRVERTTDDAIWSAPTCYPGGSYSEKYEDILVTEVIPTQPGKSANLIDLNIGSLEWATGEHHYQTCSGLFTLRDVGLYGSQLQPYMTGLGHKVTGLVGGSSAGTGDSGFGILRNANAGDVSQCTIANDPTGSNCGGTHTWPATIGQDTWTQLNNSIMWAGGGSAGPNDHKLAADVKNSMIFNVGNDGWALNIRSFVGSVYLHEDPATNWIDYGTRPDISGTSWDTGADLLFDNFVLWTSSTETGDGNCINDNIGDTNFAKPVIHRGVIGRRQGQFVGPLGCTNGSLGSSKSVHNFDFQRVSLLSSTNATRGFNATGTNGTAVSANVDAGTHTVMKHLCSRADFAFDRPAWQFYRSGGPPLDDTLISSKEMKPWPGDPIRLIDLIATPGRNKGCQYARPDQVGLTQWRRQHIMLGDFAYEQRGYIFGAGTGLADVSSGGGSGTSGW